MLLSFIDCVTLILTCLNTDFTHLYITWLHYKHRTHTLHMFMLKFTRTPSTFKPTLSTNMNTTDSHAPTNNGTNTHVRLQTHFEIAPKIPNQKHIPTPINPLSNQPKSPNPCFSRPNNAKVQTLFLLNSFLKYQPIPFWTKRNIRPSMKQYNPSPNMKFKPLLAYT